MYDLRKRYSKACGKALLNDYGSPNRKNWEEADRIGEEWTFIRNNAFDDKDLATIKAWELVDDFFQENIETLIRALNVFDVEVVA
jgi:hypothetical protein